MKGKRNILAAGLILALSASVWGCQSRERGLGRKCTRVCADLCGKSGRGLSYYSGSLQICELVKQRTGGKVEILINAEGILGMRER